MALQFSEREDKEREHHNRRWAGDDPRHHLHKWYFALKPGMDEQDRLVRESGAGGAVLELGCADGLLAIEEQRLPATVGSYFGIDISDVAVEKARVRAAQHGYRNCRFAAVSAEATGLDSGSFNVVYGRGIIHHLDLDRAYAEASRLLVPGGKAIFFEPLGYNPVLNGFRKRTPEARTDDERPLLEDDIFLARKHFRDVRYKAFGLTSVLSVPVRKTKAGPIALGFFAGIDRLLFALPPIRRQAWYALMLLTK